MKFKIISKRLPDQGDFNNFVKYCITTKQFREGFIINYFTNFYKYNRKGIKKLKERVKYFNIFFIEDPLFKNKIKVFIRNFKEEIKDEYDIPYENRSDNDYLYLNIDEEIKLSLELEFKDDLECYNILYNEYVNNT